MSNRRVLSIQEREGPEVPRLKEEQEAANTKFRRGRGSRGAGIGSKRKTGFHVKRKGTSHHSHSRAKRDESCWGKRRKPNRIVASSEGVEKTAIGAAVRRGERGGGWSGEVCQAEG